MFTSTYKTDIDNGFYEISVKLYFEYEPEEKQTMNYPGFSEQLTIYDCELNETGEEICLLPDFQMILEEEIQEFINTERGYLKYGYLLS